MYYKCLVARAGPKVIYDLKAAREKLAKTCDKTTQECGFIKVEKLRECFEIQKQCVLDKKAVHLTAYYTAVLIITFSII